MRPVLIMLLLAWWVATDVVAQTSEAPPSPDDPEQLLPCVAPDTTDVSGTEEEGGDPLDVECPEPAPETLPAWEQLAAEASMDAVEAEALEEEVLEEDGLENSASPEDEFTPDDEISEDFPVPLPADI